MKSNELMEQIHSGEIKDNTKINVMTELGKFITTILYKNNRLEWNPGEFDTKYLCDIETEFEVEEDDKIEELKIKEDEIDKWKLYYPTNKELMEKINEVIKKLNSIEQ